MALQHDRLRDPCSFVFGMTSDEWVGLRKEWDEALEQIRYLEADKRVCSELLRNQGEIADELARLRAENEQLRELLIEALFDGTAIKSDDWKDRVHQALGSE